MSNENASGPEPTGKLRPDMSVQEFDDGYYYAADLKMFARELGMPVGNRRKIELEQVIREFLATGRIPTSKPVSPRRTGDARDHLALDVVVENYVGDRTTKDFLLACVRAEHPNLHNKSGQWYWLNDWRREMQDAHIRFTYQDLVDRLRELMQAEGRLPQIPSARMNNFITDYRADLTNPPVSRDQLMQEWQWLKEQPGPKTYAEYQRRKPQG